MRTAHPPCLASSACHSNERLSQAASATRPTTHRPVLAHRQGAGEYAATCGECQSAARRASAELVRGPVAGSRRTQPTGLTGGESKSSGANSRYAESRSAERPRIWSQASVTCRTEMASIESLLAVRRERLEPLSVTVCSEIWPGP